ncbi:MAG: pyridoxamine 5'-phosphate oxidase family protein [Cyanobacteria bacterium J06642_2]
MAKFYDELTEPLQRFVAKQQIFFTGTAPHEGRVNVSPKGMDTFRCLSSKEVAYLDLTGSGNETSAHIEENGRLTLMLCSFVGKPTILRMYGRGRVIRQGDADWKTYAGHFELLPGARQIIKLDIDSVQTSCGFGVPMYEYAGDRSELVEWAEKKGDRGLHEYRHKKNRVSIDGLPTGLRSEIEA